MYHASKHASKLLEAAICQCGQIRRGYAMMRLVDYMRSEGLDVQASGGVLRNGANGFDGFDEHGDGNFLQKKHQAKSPRRGNPARKRVSIYANPDIFAETAQKTHILPASSQLPNTKKGNVDSIEAVTVLALAVDRMVRGEVDLMETVEVISKMLDGRKASAVCEMIEILRHRTPSAIGSEHLATLQSNVLWIGWKSMQSRVASTLKNKHYTHADLAKFVERVKQPNLSKALDVVDPASYQWPRFMVQFTLRRYCNSRLAAYALCRWFSILFPRQKGNILMQQKMVIRVTTVISKWLPELLPTVLGIALDPAHHKGTPLDSILLNQLLWICARFGCATTPRETELIIQAQGVIVDYMTRNDLLLDTKGYLAIAYVVREDSPERALAFLKIIKTHTYPYSLSEVRALKSAYPELSIPKDRIEVINANHGIVQQNLSFQGRFPYLHGVKALELLMAKTSDQALSVFDTIPHPNGLLWALLLKQLRRLRDLPFATMDMLWAKIRGQAHKNPNLITPYLLSQVVMGYRTMAQAMKVMADYPELVDIGFLKHYLKVASNDNRLWVGDPEEQARLDESGYTRRHSTNHESYSTSRGLDLTRQVVAVMEHRPRPVLNAMLAGELYYGAPEKMWAIYMDMLDRQGYEPDAWTLYYMCKAAATRPTLRWDGLFAAQRMSVEFKHWVRGAYIDGGDSDHLLKLFPSPALFHQYIVMIGKADYQDDLLEVLPWMQRIGFTPDKLCLSALITYSDNGQFLLKHGRVSGAGGEWPTEIELKMYQNSQKAPKQP